MFHFKKKRKIKAIKEIILLWHSVTMQYVENKKLSEPRPLVGACCFFIGSIDGICQATKLDDKDFGGLTATLMVDMNFPKAIVISIMENFYGKNERIAFAYDAIKLGIDSLLKWYNNSFLDEESAKALSIQINEWYKNPDISPSELALFGIKD